MVWMFAIGLVIALAYLFLNRMYDVKRKPSFFGGIYSSDDFTVGIMFFVLIVIWPIVLAAAAIIFGAFGLVWAIGNGCSWIIEQLNKLFDRMIK